MKFLAVLGPTNNCGAKVEEDYRLEAEGDMRFLISLFWLSDPSPEIAQGLLLHHLEIGWTPGPLRGSGESSSWCGMQLYKGEEKTARKQALRRHLDPNCIKGRCE